MGAPAGWYEKSEGSGRFRWWDGQRWGEAVQKWEYHVERMDVSERWSSHRSPAEVQALQIKLNLLGRSGWELVSYESVPMPANGVAYLVFFKRPML